MKDEDLKDWPGMPGYIKEGAVWHWGTGALGHGIFIFSFLSRTGDMYAHVLTCYNIYNTI